MNKMTIHGAEYPIQKIFCDDFFFTIPLYQRAYAWTIEESEELFQDLIRALDGYEESIDDAPPYFLGSIVLIKDDDPDAQVIDGQQRPTTLTMLLAALRSLLKPEYADGLTTFLREKGNIITGISQRYHLKLRKQDAEFFQTYIQDESGIERLTELKEASLPESQRNLRDNALGFMRELQKLSEYRLNALTQFIVKRCFLIVVSVSSPNLDSVYRIFSVLNSRGLDLSYPDILKSEIIINVPENLKEIYATKWEELESLLGREIFEDLFYCLRTIFARERLRKGMIEEFHEYVYPGLSQTLTAQDFIDNTLTPYAKFLNNIVKANYHFGNLVNEINGMFKWLNQLDNVRWLPPALYYFKENWHQPKLVLQFLRDLERLVVSFMIRKTPP